MKNKKSFFNRYLCLFLIIIFVFSVLGIRLYNVQIVNNSYYSELASHKTIKAIPETAARGTITDINGNILATSKESYMITFTETNESDKCFFQTMQEVFKMLDESGETQKDDFPLKVDPFRFEFQSGGYDWNLLRFEKDRGFDDSIIYKLMKKQKVELTDDEKEQIQPKEDSILKKITPEEAFNELWAMYTKEYTDKKSKNYNAGIASQLQGMSVQEKRRYMLVKDAIKMQSYSGYKPIVVAEDVKKETAIMFLQRENELPGIDVSIQPIRTYPNGELAANVIGYVSNISASQEEKYEEKGYDSTTDVVGQSGIESAFENVLKGSKGEKIVEVNSSGRISKEKATKEAYPGDNVQLTIDTNIQKAAESALNQDMQYLQIHTNGGDTDSINATRGAVVVTDVKTGAILASVSQPSFDPNIFTSSKQSDKDLINSYINPDIEKLGTQYITSKGITGRMGMSLTDTLNRMFPKDSTGKRSDMYDVLPKNMYDYVSQPTIPPGSTFKMVTGLAALSTGAINTGTYVDDQATFTGYDGHKYTFYADGAHGPVNIFSAIGFSSNPFFMTAANNMIDNFKSSSFDIKKYDKIANVAWQFGLGVRPGSNEKASTGVETNENFGQVYNVTSYQNTRSTQFLWNIESMFKYGEDTSSNKNVYPAIYLYDDDNDSDTVKNVKKQLRTELTDSIKSGKFDTNKVKNLLNLLIKSDPKYGGKSFSKNDITAACTVAKDYILYTAHNDLITPYNVYNAAIGQGVDDFTPLQMASYVTTIANGGNRLKLHYVDEIKSPDGKVIQKTKPQVLNKVNIDPKYFDIIKQGMSLTTIGGGTASAAFNGFPMKTSGKTGSATFSSDQDQYGRTSFSWYVGFAPSDNPQIAVTVVIFDGGHGGSDAPIARSVYEAYFKDELQKQYNYTPSGSVTQGAAKD